MKLRWPISEVVIVVRDPSKVNDLKEVSNVLAFLSNAKNVVITTQINKCLSEDYVAQEIQGYVICIPRKLNRDLYLEALARELIRRIQVMRNKLSLNIEEYIVVGFRTSDNELIEAIKKFRNYLMSEVRAKEIADEIRDDMYVVKWRIEGKEIEIGIKRNTQD